MFWITIYSVIHKDKTRSTLQASGNPVYDFTSNSNDSSNATLQCIDCNHHHTTNAIYWSSSAA
ncbi:hypothetical protein N7523_004103 [Penicillium sp. IBT 18751x]|nr:hypothetical protein N7523_004103 [Penicillium sp. IBT 18751x]